MDSIMITGATGFIGAHVAREATRRGAEVTLVSHRRHPQPSATHPVQNLRANLAEPESLPGLCDGVDVLLHCASQIGGTPESNHAVNARGTAALVAEAQRAGVSRVVYLSTAAVYGRGTFRCARPETLDRRPRSPTSRTRAEAEDAVLAAGGIVLRPHLVLGRGDAWVVPGLTGLLRTLSCTPWGWETRHSVIAVSELAALVVAAGLAARTSLTASVYHAARPEPVTASALLEAVADRMAPPPARQAMDFGRARERLAGDGGAAHAWDMLATDHWFDSAPLWADVHREPGQEPPLACMRDAYPAHAAA